MKAVTAASGVSYVGILLAAKSRRAGRAAASPSQAVSTGMPRSAGSDSTTAVAAPRLSATAVGQFMIRMASVSGSARSASTRLPIAFRGRVAEHVDGVSPRPGRRQERVEPGESVRRQRREPAASILERIGGEHAGAAAIGHHRQAIAVHAYPGGQRRHRLEQLAQLLDAQHSRSAKGGVIDEIGPGERAGVGHRRLRARPSSVRT